MNKDKSIYVIRRNNGNAQDHDHYVTHGTMGGMEDAIGYGKLSDARKFLTKEAAQAHIDHELPAWSRGLHHPAEVFPQDLAFAQAPLAWYLHHPEVEIPPEFLEPAKGRLLIWRR